MNGGQAAGNTLWGGVLRVKQKTCQCECFLWYSQDRSITLHRWATSRSYDTSRFGLSVFRIESQVVPDLLNPDRGHACGFHLIDRGKNVAFSVLGHLMAVGSRAAAIGRVDEVGSRPIRQVPRRSPGNEKNPVCSSRWMG